MNTLDDCVIISDEDMDDWNYSSYVRWLDRSDIYNPLFQNSILLMGRYT